MPRHLRGMPRLSNLWGSASSSHGLPNSCTWPRPGPSPAPAPGPQPSPMHCSATPTGRGTQGRSPCNISTPPYSPGPSPMRCSATPTGRGTQGRSPRTKSRPLYGLDGSELSRINNIKTFRSLLRRFRLAPLSHSDAHAMLFRMALLSRRSGEAEFNEHEHKEGVRELLGILGEILGRDASSGSVAFADLASRCWAIAHCCTALRLGRPPARELPGVRYMLDSTAAVLLGTANPTSAGSMIPPSDKSLGSVTPTSDKSPGSVAPPSDKSPGSVTPTSDKSPGSVAPPSDKSPGSVAPPSDKSPGSVAPSSGGSASEREIRSQHQGGHTCTPPSLVRDDLDPKSLAKLIWALAKLEYHHPPLWSALAATSTVMMPTPPAAPTQHAGHADRPARTARTVSAVRAAPKPSDLHCFDAQGVSNILWAFATLGIKDVPLITSSCAALEHLGHQGHGLQGLTLSSSIWALAKLEYPAPQTIQRLSQLVVESSAAAAAVVAVADGRRGSSQDSPGAKVGRDAEALLLFTSRASSPLPPSSHPHPPSSLSPSSLSSAPFSVLADCDSQALANLAWGLAVSNCYQPPAFDHLADALLHCVTDRPLNPAALSLSLWSFSKVKHCPAYLVQAPMGSDSSGQGSWMEADSLLHEDGDEGGSAQNMTLASASSEGPATHRSGSRTISNTGSDAGTSTVTSTGLSPLPEYARLEHLSELYRRQYNQAVRAPKQRGGGRVPKLSRWRLSLLKMVENMPAQGGSTAELSSQLALQYALQAWKLYDSVCAVASSQLDRFSDQDLCNLLQACVLASHHHPPMMKAVALEVTRRAESGSASPDVLYFTAWALAKFRVYDESFFTSACAAATQLLPRMHPQCLTGLMWSLAEIRHYDADFFEAASLQLQGLFSSGACSERDICCVARAFAQFNHYNRPACQQLSAAVQRQLPNMNLQHISNVLWSLSVLQHFDEELISATFAAAERAYQEKGQLEFITAMQLFQAQNLLNDVFAGVIELPSKLSGGLMDTCERLWVQVASRSIHVSHFQKDVYQVLHSLGAKPQLEAPTSDHHFFIDVAVSWKGKLVAVEVDGPHHYSCTTPYVPLGGTIARWRCIEMRSWRVVSVPFFHWRQLPDVEAKQRYLLDALDGVLWRTHSATPSHVGSALRLPTLEDVDV